MNTGDRFGRLVVVASATPTRGPDGVPRVLCRCDCGRPYAVRYSDLRRPGNTTRCRVCQFAGRVRAGKRYGRLKAIRPTAARSHGCVVWLCRCRCGNETLVRSGNLSGAGPGKTRSCGRCGPAPGGRAV